MIRKISKDEYDYLMACWGDRKQATYYATGEILYEDGMIDVFGFVTPDGERSIEGYREDQ